MNTKSLSLVLLAVGFGLLAIAGLDYFQVMPIASLFGGGEGPYVDVSQTDFEVGDGKAGKPATLDVVLTNRSARPVRIVGLTKC